jgi:ElaB/YqjD/DUF883 family membrane-anchored ribosome-binding protein
MSVSTTALNEDANRTVDQLKALIREAEAALAQAGSDAGEGVQNLRDRLRSAYAEGKNTFSHAADIARKQAARADALVHENPYTTVGIATAMGLILGFLLARPWASRD